jgi:hypothetical protein
MRRVLQIVPRGSPPEEALAQVAARLDESWVIAGKVASRTIAASMGRERLQAAVEATLPGEAILLHYVGYGYARRGAPLWLFRLLRRWRSGMAGRRLLVHFHEVAASGPPWRSSFWLSPLQRRVAARIGRLAHGAVTSLEAYAGRLRRMVPSLRIEVLPIFSPIGEPVLVRPWSERPRALALFGSPRARRDLWALHRNEVESAVDALAIERVLEIGGKPGGPPTCGGRPVERLGELESARVGGVFLDCRAALFGYPLEFLDKSSAFAAACAYGLLPICCARGNRTRPVAGEGERWTPAAGIVGKSDEDLTRIAALAKRWYETHDLARHARAWADLLEP